MLIRDVVRAILSHVSLRDETIQTIKIVYLERAFVPLELRKTPAEIDDSH